MQTTEYPVMGIECGLCNMLRREYRALANKCGQYDDILRKDCCHYMNNAVVYRNRNVGSC